jgi:hypothetical protein
MKSVRVLASSALLIMLAGCAGSVSAPTPIQALSAEQRSALHVSTISADAAGGVEMSDGDFGLICQKVRGYIQQEAPGVMVDPSTGQALQMKIHFTRFDRGNAFARAMLIGLGQIRIEATVELTDPHGMAVAQYAVSKDFALGGVVGASTSVEDVEEGFAKSIAEVVKTKV